MIINNEHDLLNKAGRHNHHKDGDEGGTIINNKSGGTITNEERHDPQPVPINNEGDIDGDIDNYGGTINNYYGGNDGMIENTINNAGMIQLRHDRKPRHAQPVHVDGEIAARYRQL